MVTVPPCQPMCYVCRMGNIFYLCLLKKKKRVVDEVKKKQTFIIRQYILTCFFYVVELSQGVVALLSSACVDLIGYIVRRRI